MDIKMIKIVVIVIACAVASMGFCSLLKQRKLKMSNFAHIGGYADVSALFAATPAHIAQLTNTSIADMQRSLDAIIAIPADQRTYANTVASFDETNAISDLAILRNVFSSLEMVSPQAEVRTAAHDAVLKINEFLVDAVENNVALYNAIKAYAEQRMSNEQLTPQQRYFVEKLLEDFKRSGLELPDLKRERITQLKKELSKLGQEFELNIAQDNRTITVHKEGLAGLDEDFIATLPRDGADGYKLGVDYPTYFQVMENCTVPETRKKLYFAFNNRAYPINEANLKLIIAKRDELAKELGFESYAQYDLADQMVESPERATSFLQELRKKASAKDEQEYQDLVADLPEGVTLRPDGKINPWDLFYIKNQYKKKYYALDEQKIAEYFPMQKTIDGLLNIYEQFLGLKFKEVQIPGLWHEDVRVIEAYDAITGQLLGYLLLDLYPRPNKFNHACQITLMPAILQKDGSKPTAVLLVIANFPKPTPTKPSLLKRSDVNTFFHEFGHAVHALLGRTPIYSMSGTSVKTDFVEMPSQMLEEWLWDPAILKTVSSHYKTGEPLPDDLIASILKIKNFDTGFSTLRQLSFALMSLAYFEAGREKDIAGLQAALTRETVPHIFYDPENHQFASFGHLTGYGAKYYGYMWSKVFALDLFYEIKKHGLLNPVIGKKYTDLILQPGGTQDPNQMLKAFLGREPNQEAFLQDLGL